MYLRLGSPAQTVFLVTEEDTIASGVLDTVQMSSVITDHIFKLIGSGHIFASLDQIEQIQDSIYCYFYKGPSYQYRLGSIRHSNGSVFQEQVVQEQPLPAIREILNKSANTGYPFTRVRTDSLTVDGTNVVVDFVVNTGPFIVFDTIETISPVSTKIKFLWMALDIVPGEPFSEKRYRQVTQNTRRLSYLSLKRPPDIAFSGGRAKVFVDLLENKSNRFDGIVGLLPNQSAGGKPLVTGFLDLHLVNLFHTGKSLSFNWQRFGEQSQSIKLDYKHPFLFGTRIDIGGGLSILKQDTSFLTRDLAVDLRTVAMGKFLVGFSYSNESSQPISKDIQTTIPYTTNWYGMHFSGFSMRGMFERKSDYFFETQIRFGNKSMDQPDSVTGEVTLTSFSANLEIGGQYLFHRSHAIYSSSRLGMIQNDRLVQNELMRLGGLQTLRGFNENQFYVNGYWSNQIEYRYFFESSSFLQGFIDVSYLTKSVTPGAFDYWTKSFGVGMNLAVQNGVFKIIFANGFHEDQPLDFVTMKIHFGYVAIF